jgi:hypothetical protein
MRRAFLGLLLLCVALGAAACGGGGNSTSTTKSTFSTATDAAQGITINVDGDQVTLKRSKTSTAGKGGYAGQVACTDDYAKLAVSKREPAPSEPWYAATLITWPAQGEAQTATLSHALKGFPDLCVAEMSDLSVRSIVYFHPGLKDDLNKLQQSVEPTRVLQAASSLALATVSKSKFPSAADIVTALNSQNFFTTQTPTVAGVTDVGAVYVIASESDPDTLVLAMKDANGTVHLAKQPAKGGNPQITTLSHG